MPDQQEPKTFELIVVRIPPSLAKKIDKERGRLRLSRSQFLRDALGDKLQSLGVQVTDEEISAPDRKGVGNTSKRNKANTAT
jgi:metal-responsive CopG/Arc/MetJ family transcriptional regulator